MNSRSPRRKSVADISPRALLLAAAAAAGCAYSQATTSRARDFTSPAAENFARSILKIKVINYTDAARKNKDFSPAALQVIKSGLEKRGYEVEVLSELRTMIEERSTSLGVARSVVLKNTSALHAHEAYLEVFSNEEMWEGERLFTDYEEVGSVDETFEPRMLTRKIPNLRGHTNIRRSVEVQAHLFHNSQRNPIYSRGAYVKHKEFNYARAIGLALGGIPKRRR